MSRDRTERTVDTFIRCKRVPRASIDCPGRYTDGPGHESVLMDKPFLEATISIRGVVREPDAGVLVLRRASDGGWELPGGRIHRAESVTDCLQRELREEAGLTVSIDVPVHAIPWQNDDGDDRFAVYYRCEATSTDVDLSDEHTDSKWVEESIVGTRLSEPQTTAANRALDGY